MPIASPLMLAAACAYDMPSQTRLIISMACAEWMVSPRSRARSKTSRIDRRARTPSRCSSSPRSHHLVDLDDAGVRQLRRDARLGEEHVDEVLVLQVVLQDALMTRSFSKPTAL